jgi:murein DD-endopeptidase MepM/ murein hydrolase activator NlpD
VLLRAVLEDEAAHPWVGRGGVKLDHALSLWPVAVAGRVVLAEERDGYGLTLMLEHGGGWQSLYAHLQTTLQAVGTWVAAGTPLGQVGQSGRASTPHLHVEWRRRTPQGPMAVNPTALLEQAMGMAFVQR